MGQKVHPIGIRLGITKEWSSNWYADSQTYAEYVHQDHQVREFITDKLKDASVSRIQIDRPAKRANITIHTARPGIVIGKKGEDIERLRIEVAKLLGMVDENRRWRNQGQGSRKIERSRNRALGMVSGGQSPVAYASGRY